MLPHAGVLCRPNSVIPCLAPGICDNMTGMTLLSSSSRLGAPASVATARACCDATDLRVGGVCLRLAGKVLRPHPRRSCEGIRLTDVLLCDHSVLRGRQRQCESFCFDVTSPQN